MHSITPVTLEQHLQLFRFPFLEQDLLSSGWLQAVDFKDSTVNIKLKFGFPLAKSGLLWKSILQQYVMQLPFVQQVHVDIDWQIRSHSVAPGLTVIPQIKNIIAVASCKGGVGKSTTTVNLAVALQQEGARVGLLDADIYGPNQPHLLGINHRPEIREDKKLIPIEVYNLQTMSMGYLIEATTPMIWRGPMVSAALMQLLQDTLWDNLDYLLVDLPPGTGDIQLTLAKKVPVTGAVLVTTPQEIALLDVRKGLEMFRKVDVDVLGIIENMSGHTCTQCGHQELLFGEGGGQRLAQTCEVPLLGQLPLTLAIREASDSGCPLLAKDSEGALANLYRQIAICLVANMAKKKINYASKFPKIVVEK